MSNIDDIYEIDTTPPVDNLEYYNAEIDFYALTKQYAFKDEEKKLLLHAFLSLEVGEPNMELIPKALKLIQEYKSASFEIEVNKLEGNEAKGPLKEELRDAPIDIVFVNQDEYVSKNKKMLVSIPLAFFLGPLGLLYVSRRFALGLFLFIIIGGLIYAPLILLSPFIGAIMAIVATNEYNKVKGFKSCIPITLFNKGLNLYKKMFLKFSENKDSKYKGVTVFLRKMHYISKKLRRKIPISEIKSGLSYLKKILLKFKKAKKPKKNPLAR